MTVSWKKLVLATLTAVSFLSLLTVQKSCPQDKLPAPNPVAPDKGAHAKSKDEPDSNVLAFNVPSQLATTQANLIDLATALNLAGVRNPQLLIARERILEATALRQLAAAQFLPSLHMGTSYDNHSGNLQQSNGNILKVNRDSMYVGAGANAVAAGTVTIPGIEWSLNVSQTLFRALEARQVVRRRQFTQRAVENDMLLRVALAYLEIVRAEGHRVLAHRNLQNTAEVVRLLDAYEKTGQGRQSDADRARTEFLHRQEFLQQAEGGVLTASARLTELLDLPPEPHLHPIEDKAVPCPAVPDPVPLPELLTIAVLNRPELQEKQAAIRQAMLGLEGAKVLPFSPTILVGLSYGEEAGGSSLVSAPAGANPFAVGASRFGTFADRADLDAVMFWTLQNMGAGNWAQIKLARANLGSANLQLIRQLNDVRAQVATAYARIRARLIQIDACEQAVKAITTGYDLDFQRIRGGVGLPIELLNSLRLLCDARVAYLDAIVDYNRAQMELFVALGQPPADTLARPVPQNAVVPPAPPK